MFTMIQHQHLLEDQHMLEESKALTVIDIQDLFRVNKKIKKSLKKLQVNCLLFDSVDALFYLLMELENLSRVGYIEIHHFVQDDREKIQKFVDKLEREKNIRVILSHVLST